MSDGRHTEQFAGQSCEDCRTSDAGLGRTTVASAIAGDRIVVVNCSRWRVGTQDSVQHT